MACYRRVTQAEQRYGYVVDYRRECQAEYIFADTGSFSRRFRGSSRHRSVNYLSARLTLSAHLSDERSLHETLHFFDAVVLAEQEHEFGDCGLRSDVMTGDDSGGE